VHEIFARPAMARSAAITPIEPRRTTR